MTPTLAGRLQTRLVAVLVVGLPWTIVVTPFLPNPQFAPLGDVYTGTLTVLTLVLVLGIGWEFLYHQIQQYRWEKDWPTLFGLLTGVNEGLLCFLVGRPLVDALVLEPGAADFGFTALPGSTFFVHFTTTWLLIWAFTGGPLRIFSLRWRIDGGRFW